MNTNRGLAVALALVVALAASSSVGVSAAGVCDPQRSNLCVGLVDVWQFDVVSNSSAYYGSYADTVLLKSDGGDLIQGNDKVGGTASLILGRTVNDSLVSRRSGGFTSGNWTVASWVWITPTSTARDVVLFTTYDWTNLDGFLVRFTYSTSAWFLQAVGWEEETGTSVSKTYATSTTTTGWHAVVVTFSPYGPYGKSRVCLSIDNAAPQCGSLAYALKGNSRDLTIGAAPAGMYNQIYLDGFGIWSRTWDTKDIALFYKSGAGRAFPFYP